MPRYTMRLTRLSNPPDPNDFIFLCDGLDVGRCKLEMLAGAIQKWTWTIYIAGGWPAEPQRRWHTHRRNGRHV